jgi:hypothetical protein
MNCWMADPCVDVRYWHLAHIDPMLSNVRFEG